MKKKLAIIVTHPIQYNVPLFRMLAARGHIEIMVFYTWGASVMQKKYDPGFGKVVEWDIPLLEDYPSQFLHNKARQPGSHHFKGIVNPDIIHQIDSWHPDAILVYGWNFWSHLKVMRHYKGKTPVFFRGDSTMLDNQRMMRSFIRRIFLRWIYRHVDKVFYVGTRNREYFERNGVREAQLIPAFHAVDNTFFSEKNDYYEKEAARWRQALDIQEDGIVFLFAGKFETKKSPGLLLEAFRVGGFERSACLIFAGDGLLEARLREEAKNANVRFIGFQNQTNMPVVYRLANIFVLPSGGPGETWGLAINEAMASGRPVIASTKCGGVIDLITNDSNGYIFRSGEVNDLLDKMHQLADNKGKATEMGRNALLQIQKFSLEAVACAIEKATLGGI